MFGCSPRAARCAARPRTNRTAGDADRRRPSRGGGVEAASSDQDADSPSITQKLAVPGVAQRMKAAMKGTKSERATLIRDPNKLVSSAVLSSPKLTEREVAAT
jgi:hypothetical protein